MTKIGTFRGYDVYRLTEEEWQDMDTRDLDKIFVVKRDVFFHDERVGIIDNWNQLHNFNEKHFAEVEKEAQRRKETKAQLGNGAATEVPSASKPDKETSEPAAAVDEFMDSWLDNIEKELAILKQKELEYETCKVE